MDNTNIVEFHNVTFCYDADEGEQQPEPAIRDFTFNVKKGEFVAVLGHNGSGKSTVAKLTNGILTADEGEIIVDGIMAENDESIYSIRRKVGMVFQNPDNQIVSSIVEEDVAFGVENLGIEPSECRKRVDEALKTGNMYDYRLRTPSKLSGGQKQRVAVAGIIAMKPKCIVLDEPTAMLDPSGRKEVLDTIIKLNKQENITILLITHYMDEAVLADRVVVMDNGAIMLDGTPREDFSNPEKMDELYLEVPQSPLLAHKLGLLDEQTVLNSQECAQLLYNNLKR